MNEGITNKDKSCDSRDLSLFVERSRYAAL